MHYLKTAILIAALSLLVACNDDSAKEVAEADTTTDATEQTQETETMIPETTSDTTTSTQEAPQVKYLGEELAINNTIYRLDAIEVADTVAGYTAAADAFYFLVQLTIYNNGNSAITINDSNMFRVFVDDKYYDVDNETTMFHDGGFFLEQLNPGIQKTATIVYEMPRTASTAKSMGLEIAQDGQYAFYGFTERPTSTQ